MSDARPRFMTLDQVAEELGTSRAQVYALVRGGQLRAVKIGGRGQWRVERAKLEDWISGAYEQTAAWLAAHPFDPTRPAEEAEES